MSFTFSATTSNPEIPIILYYICYILSNCIILNSLFRKRSAGHGSTRDEGQRWIRPVLILDPLHSTPIDPFMCADLPKDTRNNHDRHWRDNVDFPVCSLVMCCPYKLCVLTLIDSQAHTHTVSQQCLDVSYMVAYTASGRRVSLALCFLIPASTPC